VLYPFLDPPYRMTMGLLPLDPAEWILVVGDFGADIAERERLLAERHAEVFAALPGSEAGSREALALLARHLREQHPDRYRGDDTRLTRLHDGRVFDLDGSALHPLDLAGRLVQEDLCLMRPEGDSWMLTAASLCFPTRWRLADKIGRPLAPIHVPVPGFDKTLGTAVERFFQRLAPGKSVWRANWGLIDDPALFQPTGHYRNGGAAGITAANAGETIWLRVERQTLRRLPETGDILFTIRILRETLAETAALPARARRLAELVRSMNPELKAYKSITPYVPALLTYLDRRGAEAQ
jgi:hypothetical protein